MACSCSVKPEEASNDPKAPTGLSYIVPPGPHRPRKPDDCAMGYDCRGGDKCNPNECGVTAAGEVASKSSCDHCGGANCHTTSNNLPQMFPDLQVRPRPEPVPAEGPDHDAWLLEYAQWGPLRCPCTQGYFCRVHAGWISGEDVASGKAARADEQKPGSCPEYHYGDLSGVTSYMGARDAVVVASPDQA